MCVRARIRQRTWDSEQGRVFRFILVDTSRQMSWIAQRNKRWEEALRCYVTVCISSCFDHWNVSKLKLRHKPLVRANLWIDNDYRLKWNWKKKNSFIFIEEFLVLLVILSLCSYIFWSLNITCLTRSNLTKQLLKFLSFRWFEI